jgi:hypothetical protein
MDSINALNIYLSDKRKYLLMTLNIVLVIFVILEIMVWNDVSNLMTEEEFQKKRLEMCRDKSNLCAWDE